MAGKNKCKYGGLRLGWMRKFTSPVFRSSMAERKLVHLFGYGGKNRTMKYQFSYQFILY